MPTQRRRHCGSKCKCRGFGRPPCRQQSLGSPRAQCAFNLLRLFNLPAGRHCCRAEATGSRPAAPLEALLRGPDFEATASPAEAPLGRWVTLWVPDGFTVWLGPQPVAAGAAADGDGAAACAAAGGDAAGAADGGAAGPQPVAAGASADAYAASADVGAGARSAEPAHNRAAAAGATPSLAPAAMASDHAPPPAPPSGVASVDTGAEAVDAKALPQVPRFPCLSPEAAIEGGKQPDHRPGAGDLGTVDEPDDSETDDEEGFLHAGALRQVLEGGDAGHLPVFFRACEAAARQLDCDHAPVEVITKGASTMKHVMRLAVRVSRKFRGLEASLPVLCVIRSGSQEVDQVSVPPDISLLDALRDLDDNDMAFISCKV